MHEYGSNLIQIYKKHTRIITTNFFYTFFSSEFKFLPQHEKNWKKHMLIQLISIKKHLITFVCFYY